jgi:WD repeat-containing protein 70
VGCDVQQDHPSLSRCHAAVAHHNGAWFVVDLGSTHGTSVAGRRLTPWERVPVGAATPFTLASSTRSYVVHQHAGGGAGGVPPPVLPSLTPAGPSRTIPGSPGGSKLAAEEEGEWGVAPAMPPPPPRPKPVPSGTVRISLGAVRPTGDSAPADVPVHASPPAGASPAPAAAASAESRAARQAEIAALMAGFAAPARVTQHPNTLLHAASGGGAGGAGGGGGGWSSSVGDGASAWAGDDGGGSDEEDADDADAAVAAAAAAGLPVAFGSRHDRRSGPPVAKRARVDAGADEADAEGEGSRATEAGGSGGAGSASRAGRGASVGGDALSDWDRAALALRLPVLQDAELPAHKKPVTAVAWGGGGARLATGSADCHVRLYDWGTVDGSLRCTRDWVMEEGHPVTGLAFSPDSDEGKHLLACGTTVKVRLYDLEGKAAVTTLRGDMYITDPSNTKGHTAAVTGTWWHPTDPAFFWSCSLDCTVRQWRVGGPLLFGELVCHDIIRCNNAGAKKVAVTAGAPAADGKALLAGCADGSLQLFAVRPGGAGGSYKHARPTACVREAHAPSEQAITCLRWAPNGVTVASRGGGDDTVKVWDVRKLAAGPVAVLPGVSTLHGNAGLEWSPDGRVLLAGVEGAKGTGGLRGWHVEPPAVGAAGGGTASRGVGGGADGPARMALTDLFSHSLPSAASVVAVAWQPDVNQIALGCGDGHARVLYDDDWSRRGVMLARKRTASKRRADDEGPPLPINGVIIAPDALPMFREHVPGFRYGRSRADRAATEAAAAAEPHLPDFLTDGKQTFTQAFYREQVAAEPSHLHTEDAAEVLRSYAAKAAAAGSAVGVLAANLPGGKAVLASKTIEEEAAEAAAEVASFLKANVAGRGT